MISKDIKKFLLLFVHPQPQNIPLLLQVHLYFEMLIVSGAIFLLKKNDHSLTEDVGG